MSGVVFQSIPWLSVQTCGIFVDPRNPLPLAFLSLLRQRPATRETFADLGFFATAWEAAGGIVEHAPGASICKAFVRISGLPVQLQCVWLAQRESAKIALTDPTLPVLYAAFDARLAESVVVAATAWDNGMAALCAEDGMRQVGLNCSVRSDEPERSPSDPLGIYRTRPGAAAHMVFGTVAPEQAQRALAAACGYVERRLDIVRADLAQGEEKAKRELHFVES